jgi:ankyrin repeat protein
MDLWVAAQEGRKEVVEALLAGLSAVPNSKKMIVEALHIAVANDHLDVAKLLVRQETVNCWSMTGWTPLGTAALHDAAGPADLLLAAGAQIDVSGNSDWTNLELAAVRGHARVASCLLARKAPVYAHRPLPTHFPLTLAAEYGQVDMVLLLLGQHADVDKPDYYGRTALHNAADGGDAAVVVCLLGHKADVHRARAGSGYTALHYAAARSHAAVIRHLLRASAQVDAANAGGYTPLDFARERNNADVLALLRLP